MNQLDRKYSGFTYPLVGSHQHVWVLFDFSNLSSCVRPPRHRASHSGGGPREFQVGASLISPPFWFGASSTSVQLCSQSSNKIGVMQKIIAKQIDKTRLENPNTWSNIDQKCFQNQALGLLGGQGRSNVSKNKKRNLGGTVTSTTRSGTVLGVFSVPSPFWTPLRPKNGGLGKVPFWRWF